MPATIHIIPAREFVVSSGSGEFDLDETRRFLKQTLGAANFNDQTHIMLDVREGQSNMRAFEVFELVSVLEELDPPFHGKLAFLNRPKDSFNRAEFFAKCAQYRGFEVNAFQDFEQAILWLYPPEPANAIPQRATGETAPDQG